MGFLIFGLASFGTAGAASIVSNSGFEFGRGNEAASWCAARKPFSFVTGEGRNGTRALFFDVKKGSPYDFPSQFLKIEPGRTYLVEGWVMTSGLTGGGASIGLEWRKKDGSWGGGKYIGGLKGTTRGYEHLKLVADLPLDVGSCTLSPFVERGSVGRAWFDDLSVTPYEGPALGALVTDAYRNVATGGIVRATSVILMRRAVREKKGAKGSFTVMTANGGRQTLPATIEDSYARASFDASKLPIGPSEITFRLTAADGKLLGANKITFNRVAQMPNWKVRIEGTRTLVDGKPFFPIGIFLWRITKDALLQIRQGAFNCVLPYSPPTRAEMDLAQSMGLMVIYSIKDAYYGTRACVGEIKGHDDEINWVKNRVAAFKNHPALLAWYINDELGVEIRDRLTARRDLVAELDPDHPTYVALYQIDDFPAYVGTFDIFGGDPYPICQVGDPPISQVTEHTRLARAAACGGAMWQIPQLFDWGAYRVRDVKKTRPPTFDEFRNMAWQFVAEGAMGLVPYSLDSMPKMEWRDPTAIQWQKHCAISHEIAAYVSAFLSTEPAPSVKGAPKGVGVRSWHANGRDYVLFVNTTREPVSAKVEIAGHGVQPLFLAPIGVEMRELR